MYTKLFGVSIVSVIAAICVSAFAADQGNPEASTPAASTPHRVVIVEGDATAKVEIGEVIRVTSSGPSGMVEITAKTEGPVKLVGANDVRRVVNGGSIIGAMIREFEVKAQGKGAAKIIVTIDNKITKKTDAKEFNLEVR